MSYDGIDVSQYQGVIDWEVVKPEIDFAILRVGYGQDQENQDDKMFKRNADECTRLNIPFGVYIYSYALNTQMAVGEANHVLRLIKGYKLAYPVYYDLEDEGTTGKLSNDEIAQIAKAFGDEMEKNKYYVGVYASLNWWQTKLTSPIYDRYTKWVARYAKELKVEGYGMWQYTDKGTVKGIKGPVDLNYGYVDFPRVMMEFGFNGYEKQSTTSMYQVGDMVHFNNVFLTTESTTPLKPYKTIGTITKIYDDVRNPYQIGRDQGYVNDQVIEGKVSYLSNPNYIGDSFVDALKQIGVDSSMENRQRIAKLNGIYNYQGTMRQNIELLMLLQKGLLIS